MLNWLNDFPGFPVSQNPENQNREAANPHGYWLSRFSRFSRFQNEGSAQQQDETADTCEKNTPPIPEHLPDPSDAIAAFLELPTPSPTPEDVAELDALIVELCELEPWLAGYLPEMQKARRSMAPANVAESLTCFRQYVSEAEAGRGAVLGADGGKLPRPESLTVTRQQKQTGNPDRQKVLPGSLNVGNRDHVSFPE